MNTIQLPTEWGGNPLDLVGLNFCWKGRDPLVCLDCYQFVRYAFAVVTKGQYTLDYIPEVYEDCPGTTPDKHLYNNFCKYMGEPRYENPRHLDIVCAGGGGVEACSLILNIKGEYYLTYSTQAGSNIKPLERFKYSLMNGFWSPLPIVVPYTGTL